MSARFRRYENRIGRQAMSERAIDSLSVNHLRVLSSGDQSILFDSAIGRISVLNQMGCRILAGIRSGLTIAQVQEEIAERYGIPIEVATRDVMDFIEQLRRNKMIRGDGCG